jgi:hypothetical protein
LGLKGKTERFDAEPSGGYQYTPDILQKGQSQFHLMCTSFFTISNIREAVIVTRLRNKLLRGQDLISCRDKGYKPALGSKQSPLQLRLGAFAGEKAAEIAN